jgi:DNA polymerase-3 subunit delta'
MSSHDTRGFILITSEIEEEFERLKEELKPSRVVGFIHTDEEFKLEHAKAVVAEAYISEYETKYIIFGANHFRNEAQNSLLKVLEEPPKNIEFIIITASKSNLLPTVRSRLPIKKGKTQLKVYDIDLNLSRPEYAEIFAFLKQHAKVKKPQAKDLVEALYYRATVVDKLILTKEQLENFDRAYRLLELNSRPQTVLAQIVMSFAGDKNAG